MDPVGTFLSPVSAIEVLDHLHQVWLGLPVILMYNMSILAEDPPGQRTGFVYGRWNYVDADSPVFEA